MSKKRRNWLINLRIERLEKRENPAPVVPVYNSNPTAFAQIYLDFDGNTGPSGWCGTSGSIVTSVFGTDGDPNTYSAAELAIIDGIWKRVAEDFAPFNINVTTVLPSDFNDKHAVRLAIGDQTGGINWSGVAGVGCLASFYTGGASNNVAFVHSPHLNNYDKHVAKTTSHEAGHTFNLLHQDHPTGGCGGYHPGGTYNGESKGPIMGSQQTRDIWWLGFEGCGTQDDMAILSNASNGFGYVADDISDVSTSARRIRNMGGTLAGNLSGVIHQTTDQDWFFFGGPAGTVDITLSAVAIGPNFDGVLELWHDVAGTPVFLTSADPSGDVFGATINFSAPAGKKYLVVKSDGDYGEVGAYSISGTVPYSPSPITEGDSPIGNDNNPLARLFEPVVGLNDESVPIPAGTKFIGLNDNQVPVSTRTSRRLDPSVKDRLDYTAIVTELKPNSLRVDAESTFESARPSPLSDQRTNANTKLVGPLQPVVAPFSYEPELLHSEFHRRSST